MPDAPFKLGPLQQEWVDALRSGKYQQGKYGLHNLRSNTWCCLGVACDVLADRLGVYRRDESDMERFDGYQAFLPAPIQIALRMVSPSGERSDGEDGSLQTQNDHDGRSFLEIADEIETNPHLYFTGPA